MRARIDEFEERLKYTNREMDIFMKKDPPVLTMDEMRSSVKVIDDINERSIKAVEDLRDINQEEVKTYNVLIYKSVNRLILKYKIFKTLMQYDLMLPRCIWTGIPRRTLCFRRFNNRLINTRVCGTLRLTFTSVMNDGIMDH